MVWFGSCVDVLSHKGFHPIRFPTVSVSCVRLGDTRVDDHVRLRSETTAPACFRVIIGFGRTSFNQRAGGWRSLLCHTAFSNEDSRDEHIKTCATLGDQAEESTVQQNVTPVSAVDSTTIYSGTKLFWRSRLSVELLMQQHQQVNAVQVRN